MERLFKKFSLGDLELENRLVLPPLKLGFGNPDGTVTDRQLRFYTRIAQNGPGFLILEPASVSQNGREHPKQLCIHLENSEGEIKKIVDVIHDQGRLVCLHLNHGGVASNASIIDGPPKAPSVITCIARDGNVSTPLEEDEIQAIIADYKSAALKAKAAGIDIIEIQAGHGYLISQFLNSKLNKREDRFGTDKLLFAKEVISSVKEGAPDTPLILRISGNEMSPEYGISQEDLSPLLKMAEVEGINAVHVGMGHACFSPPWYFHHARLPEKPQMDALAWVKEQTSLPLIVAGRMGRKEKAIKILDDGLADLVALGRPLLADPDLVEKWEKGMEDKIMYCGYCLQGCLSRLQAGQPLGCNFNPEMGLPPMEPSKSPLRVLIAGGGPAGMSSALYMSRRGHQVTLAEKTDHMGGQFDLAWQAPGKETMKDALENLKHTIEEGGPSIILNREVDTDLIKEINPDLLVWATGASQNIPEIRGLDGQNTITSLEYFKGEKELRGPRVLVIGAGRTGLEAVEKLGEKGYEVFTTMRTDPIGSMMDPVSRTLLLTRLGQMSNVTIMPHTTVKAFLTNTVDVEQDGAAMSLEPFQTVILASGMVSEPGPDEAIKNSVSKIETIGDAEKVLDIFSAVHAGYQLAQKY